jgi:hypothetical protein
VARGRTPSKHPHVIAGWADDVFIKTPEYTLSLNSIDPAKRTELFDRKADPRETENIAAAKPEVVQALRQKIEAFFGGPLPYRHQHQARPGRAPGLPQFVQHWNASNLGS